MSVQKSSTKQDRMLPASVAAVLRIRDRTDLVCPDEILARLNSLKIGKVVYHFKGASNPIHQSSSASSLGSLNSAWRGSKPNFRGNSSNHHSNNQNNGGAWGMSIRRIPSEHNSVSTPRDDETPSFRRFRNGGPPSSSPTSPQQQDHPAGSPFPPGGRYVSHIVSEKNVEDRIIGHIRSKLNKFSANNYDAIKSFLEQIMNSGETEFLSEFMDLLFMKAASEEIYCELYARLLSELTAKFPHLRTEITTIYGNFMSIFVEARDIPDQGTDDYKKFLDAQEKKKFRKGYSHFLAEIYNKGLIPGDAIEQTVLSIVSSLDKLETDSSNTLLVEEYVCSLTKIVLTINDAKVAPIPPYLVNLIDKLKSIIGKPKADTPGYTSKARFSIMDIIDAVPN